MTIFMVLKYDDRVICEDSLRNTKIKDYIDGFSLDIRINYYRGLQVSCISEISLVVDGEKISDENICFAINGKSFSLSELPYLFAEFWNIHDRATLYVEKEGGLEEGEHDIQLTLHFRSPYMQIAPRTYATIDSSASKTVCLQPGQ